MGQFVGCVAGMRAACEALDFPVVSGNVSLYNETNGQAILPTPVIGGVGPDRRCRTSASTWPSTGGRRGDRAAGRDRGPSGRQPLSAGDRGLDAGDGIPRRSIWRPNGGSATSCAGEIAAGRITACHDLSDGGLWQWPWPKWPWPATWAADQSHRLEGLKTTLHGWLFGEDQARYLVTLPKAAPLLEAAAEAGVAGGARLGTTGGQELILPGSGPISLDTAARSPRGLASGLYGWVERKRPRMKA